MVGRLNLTNDTDLSKIHFIMDDCVRYEDKVNNRCEHSVVDIWCDGCNEYKPKEYGKGNR